MNAKDMKSISKRTEQYWFEDGIWEIGFGLVNLLLAGYFFLIQRLDLTGITVLLLQLGVIITAFLGMGWLIKLFKEKVTYPRTGYVSYRNPTPPSRIKRIILTAFLALGMAALVAAAAHMDTLRNTQVVVTAILLAVVLVYLGYRFNLIRFYVVAGLTVLLGCLLSQLTLPDLLLTASFFGGFGLLMIFSGSLALLAYLSHTQPLNGTQ